MVDAARDARLAGELAKPAFVGRGMGTLERHWAVEIFVSGQPDGAHPTRADLAFDPVTTCDQGTGAYRHSPSPR
jgi:hypothetical protein